MTKIWLNKLLFGTNIVVFQFILAAEWWIFGVRGWQDDPRTIGHCANNGIFGESIVWGVGNYAENRIF